MPTKAGAIAHARKHLPEEAALGYGRKGLETRAKLMRATSDLLKTTVLRDLRASAISRRARVAIGTFYIYFENVEAVALALSWQLAEEMRNLTDLLQQPWPPGDSRPIEAFARAYFDFWDLHGPVMMVRNLAAAGGDANFLEARLNVDSRLYRLLEDKVREAKERGHIPAHANETPISGLLLGSMDHQAAFARCIDLSDYGSSREDMISAAVFLFTKTLFGDRC